MKSFDEIKSELKGKNYSKKDINLAIILYSILRILFSQITTLVFSAIPFIIGIIIIGASTYICLFYLIIHFLFYKFYVEKVYKKEIKPLYDELILIISALREIKSEST